MILHSYLFLLLTAGEDGGHVGKEKKKATMPHGFAADLGTIVGRTGGGRGGGMRPGRIKNERLLTCISLVCGGHIWGP